MLPGPWSKARLTTPNLSNGSARCGFTLTLSKLTCCSSCPFRWPTPSLTTALSTWACRTSWFRRPSLTVAIWQWHKPWRPGLGAPHLVSYFTDLDRWSHGRSYFAHKTDGLDVFISWFCVLKSLISCIYYSNFKINFMAVFKPRIYVVMDWVLNYFSPK